MRVEISSSNFPKYSHNPNTGEALEAASRFVKVRQTVRNGVDRGSYIVLPVLREL